MLVFISNSVMYIILKLPRIIMTTPIRYLHLTNNIIWVNYYLKHDFRVQLRLLKKTLEFDYKVLLKLIL